MVSREIIAVCCENRIVHVHSEELRFKYRLGQGIFQLSDEQPSLYNNKSLDLGADAYTSHYEGRGFKFRLETTYPVFISLSRQIVVQYLKLQTASFQILSSSSFGVILPST
jgi:hypothetical protein